jgi:hypothetical protein
MGTVVNPDTAARIDDVRARISSIADDFGRHLAEQINEKDAIRAEIIQTLGKEKAATVDQMLVAAMRVVTAKATEDSYRDYRIAVFQPGLSPEQRRLYFDGVLEQLALPLPRGELQPTMRAATW